MGRPRVQKNTTSSNLKVVQFTIDIENMGMHPNKYMPLDSLQKTLVKEMKKILVIRLDKKI